MSGDPITMPCRLCWTKAGQRLEMRYLSTAIQCHMRRLRPHVLGMPRARTSFWVTGFGAAADSEIVDRMEAAFAGAGFRVARNAPFAGAFITQHYGRPSQGQHTVQIEIDRALYMNEARGRTKREFRCDQAQDQRRDRRDLRHWSQRGRGGGRVTGGTTTA